MALRDVAGRLSGESGLSVDEEGRLHVAKLVALPDPASLTDLRKRVAGMLPRVDLPELLLEVMGRVKGFEQAFVSVAGGTSKLADFEVSVAACLTSQALNIGYAPVTKPGTTALERARLSHVAQTTCRPRRSLPPTPRSSTPRRRSASPGSSAAVWSPRSTGCGSWCRSRRSTPAPTASTSVPNAL
jgi:hypothetical protein